MNINNEVQKILKKYSNGYVDPFSIVKSMNIILIKEDLGKTNGFYYEYKRNRIIGINSNLNEREQRRVCSHELGHAVLHEGMNYPFLCKKAFFVSSKYEKQADLFAINLLLSEYDAYELKEFTFQDISNITAYPLKYVQKLLN
jgi:hypothetical protein